MRVCPWLASFLLVAACGDDSGLPDARAIDAAPDTGTLSLSWTIADQGVPLTCTQVGASIISLTIVPDGQVFATTDVLTCASMQGTSRALPPGIYDVSATLGDVATPAIEFEDVVVTSGQDTPIGEAAFEVQAVGGFAFQIVAGGQGNCTPPDQGGAGITAMELELEAVGGGCVPTTFDIAAGASLPATSFTSTCPAAGQAPCIAQDQTVTVAPTLATGPYRLVIRGVVGADTCWSRLSQFDVPAGGATENLPQQNLLFIDSNPACTP